MAGSLAVAPQSSGVLQSSEEARQLVQGYRLPKPEPLTQSPEEKALIERYGQQSQRLGERLAPLEAEKTKLEGEMAQVQNPPPPQLQPVPQFQERQVQQGELLTFSTVAMALAGIGAKAMHGDIVMALNGAAGAIKGFNEGNLQQAKLDIQNFNTKMGAVVANNNRMLAEYRAVLEDRKLTLAQKMNQYRVIAAKYQDEIAMSAMQKGDIAFALERQEKLRNANWQAEQLWQRTNASLMAQAIRMDAMVKMRNGGVAAGEPGGLSQDASDYLAAYVTLNGRMPIGMSRMTPAVASVMNNTAAGARKAGIGPEEWAAAGPITKEKLAALGQLEKMRNSIQSFEGMLDKNIDILKDLSKKVDRTGSPYANRPILWLQQNAAGDPDVAEYLFQVNTVSTEAARILNNPQLSGQLTDSARAELQSVVSGTLNHEQLLSVLGRAQADARNRSAMLDAQENKVIREIRDPLHAAGGTPAPGQGAPQSFPSEAAARAAGKKSGERVIINGVTGTLTD